MVVEALPVRPAHRVQTLLLRATAGLLGRLPWRAALALGAGLGTLLLWLGVRRRVARANLALAFPERGPAWRTRVLAEAYRELGRVAAEYTQLPRLAARPREQVYARLEGEEHVRQAIALGRGVIFLTGHMGNFELGAAALARTVPVAILVKPLSNPGAEAWIAAQRRRSGLELLPIGPGVRAALKRLRAGGALAMLGDQDARRAGVFVPFFGRLSSTPAGPAWLSLASGAPIVFGICSRARDGRHELRILPPIVPRGEASDPAAVSALTACHARILEAAVRERPEAWFWLHRRWKTSPDPPSAGTPAGSPAGAPPAREPQSQVKEA